MYQSLEPGSKRKGFEEYVACLGFVDKYNCVSREGDQGGRVGSLAKGYHDKAQFQASSYFKV